MRDPLRHVDVRRAVGNDQVFSRDERRSRALHVRVVVHLLERRTRKAQVVEHALVLGSVLNHLLGQAEVHVVTHPLGSLFLLPRHLANDLRLHRPLRRESLRDHLGLEPDRRFRQQG